MKNYLLLLLIMQQALGMYPPACVPTSMQSLGNTYETLIKSLHDPHIREYMDRYPYASHTQFFNCYFRVYAQRAIFNHTYRPKDHEYEDVARFSLSYPLNREQVEPLLKFCLQYDKGNADQIENKKSDYPRSLYHELAQRSMEMMKVLYL